MEAKAIAKSVRISPIKARLVVDLIRGKKAQEAQIILENYNNKASGLIKKVLDSAIANAVNNSHMKLENLEVFNFKSAFRGMRNPLNSWDRSDSVFDIIDFNDVDDFCDFGRLEFCFFQNVFCQFETDDAVPVDEFFIGDVVDQGGCLDCHNVATFAFGYLFGILHHTQGVGVIVTAFRMLQSAFYF